MKIDGKPVVSLYAVGPDTEIIEERADGELILRVQGKQLWESSFFVPEIPPDVSEQVRDKIWASHMEASVLSLRQELRKL